jgi:hypothetical protein
MNNFDHLNLDHDLHLRIPKKFRNALQDHATRNSIRVSTLSRKLLLDAFKRLQTTAPATTDAPSSYQEQIPRNCVSQHRTQVSPAVADVH